MTNGGGGYHGHSGDGDVESGDDALDGTVEC